MKMTSRTILDLLLTKHSGQLCVPECKTGSQWMKRNIRHIDLWVMNKSWTKNWTTAYEIKVLRQDFLKDEKWRDYLPYCNYFYFVAPMGIIQPEELAADCGLLIGSKNLKKLYTKKKAPYRDVKIPEEIWRYILMWRANIVKERNGTSNVEYWQNWLEDRKGKKRLGYAVAHYIKSQINQKTHDTAALNHSLKTENENLAHIKGILLQMGIDEKQLKSQSPYRIERDFKKLLAEVRTGLPEGTMDYLTHTINNLSQMQKLFERAISEKQTTFKN